MTTAGLCHSAPPPALLQGIEEFNRQQFFECHETLEELWKQEAGPIRELYRGILQIAVGCLHVCRGNYRGAKLSFERGLARLLPFVPECQGVSTIELIRDAELALGNVLTLGPERLGRFDPALFPVIRVARPDPLATADPGQDS